MPDTLWCCTDNLPPLPYFSYFLQSPRLLGKQKGSGIITWSPNDLPDWLEGFRIPIQMQSQDLRWGLNLISSFWQRFGETMGLSPHSFPAKTQSPHHKRSERTFIKPTDGTQVEKSFQREDWQKFSKKSRGLYHVDPKENTEGGSHETRQGGISCWQHHNS